MSRQSRTSSPPSPTTPARPTHSRRPSTSYTPTVISAGQQTQKVNVTRLAIEGRARQNADGASVKVYLKISLPIDSVTPGATIPLFPEENVKVLESQVHPLDNNSVPYNFSSALVPLLHNAARALNLPSRSPDTFYSTFSISPGSVSTPPSSSRAHPSETDSESTSPVDPYYAGQILVSNYAISYTLPKVFLTRNRLATNQESGSQPSYRSRRASIGERNTAQFMAAIDMWVPYVSKPPRSPYLLSIPIPRCLHNHIKLRIFPPTSTSSSVASLSSIEEDGSSWDLASDPHVTRVASNRLTRTNSYSHFADDESSDSSQVGLADGCGIQGTFPSAERIKIRWARPMKVVDVPDGGDGRRRVGVREVKGEMTCVVQGKYNDPEKNVEGAIMRVAFKGTCKGIWFPGVATLLGMDVGLEAKNSDVSWVSGFPSTWEVGGGVGYTGFGAGHGGPSSPSSRASSLDSSLSGLAQRPEQTRASGHSFSHPSDSTSSLLRAPLPNQNVGDYSFEGSSTESALIDAIPPSLQVSTTSNTLVPPGTPITLHLNMNELLPPVQNVFTFTISGTIFVAPRTTIARINKRGASANDTILQPETHDGSDSELLVLPRFTVLAADAESTSIVVQNEAENGAFVLEVYKATGNPRDAQIRKTVLQKGGATKCGDDGGRIVLKSVRQHPLETSPRPATPNGHMPSRVSSSSPQLRVTSPLRPKRNGPLIIPAVENKITLFTSGATFCYAVRTTLNVPCEANSEWLEFGLALPRTRKARGKPPKVSIINASIEGVPVRTEMTTANTPDKTMTTSIGAPSNQARGVEWIAWIRLHAGSSGSTHALVDYLVRGEGEQEAHCDNREHFLLPTFALPVGRLDGRIDGPPDLSLSDLDTNLTVQRCDGSKCKFSHFSAAEFFSPQVSLIVNRKRKRKTAAFESASLLVQALPWLALFVTLFLLQRATTPTTDPSHLPAHLSEYANLTSEAMAPVTVTTTTTTTAYSTITITSTIELTTDCMESLSPTTIQISDTITPLTSDQSTISSAAAQRPTIAFVETAAVSLSSPPLWPIPWPIENVHMEVVLDKLRDAAEVVWQWAQRAYHYPLDPP